MTANSIKVKICGVRRLADALVAADAGADFVGMVFVPERHRRITPEAAKEIVDGLRAASRPGPKTVGLFADQPLDEVNRVIALAGLDAVQLCGKEDLDYAGNVDCQVIKVVHVPGQASEENEGEFAQCISEFRAAGHLVTLDRLVEGVQGGTGQGFDWSVAAAVARRGHSFLLAGGLDPTNVAQAIATVHPWGVDVSSGVETGGEKDHAKIREFIANARDAAKAGSR